MEILHAAGEAFFLIFNLHTLPFLFLGVMMGLCVLIVILGVILFPFLWHE